MNTSLKIHSGTDTIATHLLSQVKILLHNFKGKQRKQNKNRISWWVKTTLKNSLKFVHPELSKRQVALDTKKKKKKKKN